MAKRISDEIHRLAMSEDLVEAKSFFAFDSDTPSEVVIVKFNLWARRFFPKYFKATPASFHDQITSNNLAVYRGDLTGFVNIVFRGGAKTTQTKLFIAYVITNDTENLRKYIKILTKDQTNGEQIVTDVYNMLISMKEYYPDTFKKSDLKQEERRNSFTTSFGLKMRSGTVGQEQRGAVQEESRPDFVIYDDFETRKSLSSLVETQKIWDNMEEARTGLSRDGGSVYLCNYISERGNVHRLVERGELDGWEVMVVPIIKEGVPTWDAYTLKEIEKIEEG